MVLDGLPINSTADTVTYKVTSAEAGISWATVKPSWVNATSATASNISKDTGYVTVGDFFTVTIGTSGTYTIDIIYDDHIIWTSPAVVLS